MNRENIDKVIDWLNRGAPEVVFSMRYSLSPIEDTDVEDMEDDGDGDGYYGLAPSEQAKVDNQSCGSVCCIAGAAAQFNGLTPGNYSSWFKVQEQALQFFGVRPVGIIPRILPVFDPRLAPPNCDPITAAAALQRWADNTPFDIAFNPWSQA